MSGAVHRIELPERLSASTLAPLCAALEVPGPRALVGWCEGMDPSSDPAGWMLFAKALELLHTGPPTAALVSGTVQGGGLGLVAGCDVVLCTPAARFCLPELLFGLLPAAIAPALRSRIGAQGVRAMAVSASSLDAQEASRMGLVDRVCEGQGELERSLRHLSRLEPGALCALRAMLSPRYLEEVASGLRLSQQRLPHAQGRLARWKNGEQPW